MLPKEFDQSFKHIVRIGGAARTGPIEKPAGSAPLRIVKHKKGSISRFCSSLNHPYILCLSFNRIAVGPFLLSSVLGASLKAKKHNSPIWNSIFDGFVKSPISALRCISRNFTYSYVRCIPRNLRRLDLELFSLPSKIDFLRDCHF